MGGAETTAVRDLGQFVIAGIETERGWWWWWKIEKAEKSWEKIRVSMVKNNSRRFSLLWTLRVDVQNEAEMSII